MIRILHIIPSLNKGGSEMMLLNIISSSDKSKFEHFIFCLKNNNNNIISNDILTPKNIYIFNLGSFHLIFKSLFLIFKNFKNIKPDIVISWLYAADVVSLLLKIVYKRTKIIWNIRCSKLSLAHINLKNIIFIRLLKLFSKYPELIIANSNIGKKEHQSLGYKPHSWKIIYNGFDTNKFKPRKQLRNNFKKKLNINSDDFVVGYIGKTNKIKGLDLFLEVSFLLEKKIPNIKFILVGKELHFKNKKLVKKINQYSPLKKYCLLGERDNINEILNVLDLLVLTSYSEGFPNVIGEAMSSGVPCVSSNVGECKNIIGDYGFIVSTFCKYDFIKPILKIYNFKCKDLKLIRKGARDRIRNNFSLNAIIKIYENLFTRLINEKK